MERILSDNEKIRKAEEIYYRRNNRPVVIKENHKSKKVPKTYLGSKILLEMLILVILVVIVFAVKNREYIFSQSFLENISKYNINLTEKFAFILDYFRDNEDTETEEVFINNELNQQNEVQENQENQENQEQVPVESQEQGISYIKPIEGVVTSKFGTRTSGNHTGIDIAANLGTEIKSSISGIVVQVSTEGDYGNHVRIGKDNIVTLYAHCKDICVTEGQEVAQGQVIATVGSTGNSTGPHLHFEVIVDNVRCNPEEFVTF